MSHVYLMEVQKYFGGRVRFQVVASDKDEAKEKGLSEAEKLFGRDNIIRESIRVDRKLKPSFGNDS